MVIRKIDDVEISNNNNTIEEEEPSELDNVLAELGGVDEAVVNIYRVKSGSSKGTKGGAFIDSVHPTVFSLTWLRDNCGGGDYRIHLKNAGRLVANRLVSIDAPIKKMDDDISSVNVSSNNDNNDMVARLGETMNAGFSQLGQMMLKIAEMSHPPAAAPVDTAKIQNDMLQNMSLMKQLMGGNEAVNTTSGGIEMLLKGIELAKDLGGNEREPGNTDLLMEAIKTFGKPMAEMVQAQSQLPQPQPQPQPHPQPQPQPQPQPGTEIVKNEKTEKQYADMLAALATTDVEPFPYAGVLCDQMSAEEVHELVNNPETLKKLAVHNPMLASSKLKPWLDEFISCVNEILTDRASTASVNNNVSETLSDSGTAASANDEPNSENSVR